MKAINLRGITESLSESEMKLVRGGKKVDPPKDLTIGASACAGMVPDSPCSIQVPGGTYDSFCWMDQNNSIHCGQYA